MNIEYTPLLIFLSAVSCLHANAVAQTESAPPEILIWPQGLPADAIPLPANKIATLKKEQASHPREHVLVVEEPTLSIYLADPKIANGCSVVICPGGGYNVLAWQHEGVELAKWLNSIGVSAFILKYRVPRRGPKVHWEPMQDVQRAIRMVRHDAEKYALDPDRIGVLGFSAGGHLTVMAGTQYETKSYEAVDDADSKSARPNFMCPIYVAYLADGYKDDVAELGPLVKISNDTPPAFMAVTWDDTMRGAQSALLFAELKKQGVSAELHAYAKGGHGYGIRPSENPVSGWHHQLEAWLKSSGWLKPTK